MPDIVDKSTRSKMMSSIRGKNTQPERAVRSLLHRAGFRFTLHNRALPGRPDICLPKHRAVVFVHGCFWHRHTGCSHTYNPKSRATFWQKKFEENTARDRRNIKSLRNLDWRIIIVWECAVRKEDPNLMPRLGKAILGDAPYMEIE